MLQHIQAVKRKLCLLISLSWLRCFFCFSATFLNLYSFGTQRHDSFKSMFACAVDLVSVDETRKEEVKYNLNPECLVFGGDVS